MTISERCDEICRLIDEVLGDAPADDAREGEVMSRDVDVAA